MARRYTSSWYTLGELLAAIGWKILETAFLVIVLCAAVIIVCAAYLIVQKTF